MPILVTYPVAAYKHIERCQRALARWDNTIDGRVASPWYCGIARPESMAWLVRHRKRVVGADPRAGIGEFNCSEVALVERRVALLVGLRRVDWQPTQMTTLSCLK